MVYVCQTITCEARLADPRTAFLARTFLYYDEKSDLGFIYPYQYATCQTGLWTISKGDKQ
jgi:hypothetical protein